MSIDILMPALSPTMEEGTLSKWLVKEGDKVVSGDLIAEIETDKATMEVEAIDDGVIGKILVDEGQEAIKVNVPIAILLLDGEDITDINTELDEEKNDNKSIEKETIFETKLEDNAENILTSPKPLLNSEQKEEFLDTNNKRIFITPLAKRIAKQRDIDLSLLNGSGPNGRILKIDVEKFNDNKNIKNINIGSPENFELVKNSAMRKTIADRLVKSKNEAPHFYLSICLLYTSPSPRDS